MKYGMFKISLLAGAMVFSCLAMANPSATLAVKGQVSTGTCTATLSDANIDIGNISADVLPATGSYIAVGYYDPAYTTLNLDCTSPLKYEVSFTDNRSDSPVPAADVNLPTGYDGAMFGLGKTRDGTNIGAYIISLQSFTINGSAQRMIVRDAPDGSEWTSTTQGKVIRPINNAAGNIISNYVAMASPDTLIPEATATAAFKFRIGEIFISSALRDITDVENIDGNMTFNVDYL